jgi:hypothetical protein
MSFSSCFLRGSAVRAAICFASAICRATASFASFSARVICAGA